MIATRNTEWGFYGTWQRNRDASGAETRQAYHEAATSLMERFGMTEADAVEYLDRPSGRHMADAVSEPGKDVWSHCPSWLDADVARFYRFQKAG